MRKIISFSVPCEWNCLDKLLEKLPRAINTSKAVQLSVEDMLKNVDKNTFVSLDSFKTETTTPGLEATPKIWSNILKEMDATDIRNLQKLIKKRASLVEDELYRRTL
jgi:hypothetical protein